MDKMSKDQINKICALFVGRCWHEGADNTCIHYPELFKMECPEKDFGDWGFCCTDAKGDCPEENPCNGDGTIETPLARAVKEGKE